MMTQSSSEQRRAGLVEAIELSQGSLVILSISAVFRFFLSRNK